MGGDRLKFGGEFRDAAMEHAFTAARLDETLRQCRLLFLLSAVLLGAVYGPGIATGVVAIAAGGMSRFVIPTHSP